MGICSLNQTDCKNFAVASSYLAGGVAFGALGAHVVNKSAKLGAASGLATTAILTLALLTIFNMDEEAVIEDKTHEPLNFSAYVLSPALVGTTLYALKKSSPTQAALITGAATLGSIACAFSVHSLLKESD